MGQFLIFAFTLFLFMAKPPVLVLLHGLPPNGPQEKAGAEQQTPSPRPNPDPSGKYHIGDGVSGPRLLFAPDPEFTEKAHRKRLQGQVVVGLTVDTEGKAQTVHVTHSLGEGLSEKLKPIVRDLDENAVKAVKDYRFEPAQFHGKPVQVETEVSVEYRIW